MTDELISRLERLQQIAGVMRGLMREAQATAPATARGQDTTGAVKVVLDAEGFPLTITVAADWRRRLGAKGMGTAVMDVCGKAALARMRAWTQALEEGVWARKVQRMMASELDGSGVEVPEPPRSVPAYSPGPESRSSLRRPRSTPVSSSCS